MNTGNIIKEAVKGWVKTNRAWAFTFCVFSILLFVLNWGSINHNNIENGDFAANSLLIQDAKHFALLKGNYSRVGFNHPGPAVLYCLALGEVMFYDWLPVAKSPFSGQLMGAAMYIAFWLVLMARLFRRTTDSFISSLLLVSFFLLFSTLVPFTDPTHNFYNNIWMPLLCFFPFVTFFVAVSRLSVGKQDSLGTMAISAGFLINAHASFIVLVPLIVFAALALNFLSKFIFEKRYLITFKSLLENRKKIIFAFGILFIFLLPIILLTILEYPGPLAQYREFSKAHNANSLREAITFISYYWGGREAFFWGLFSLLLIAITIKWWKQFSDMVWGVFSAIVASTIAVLYYAIKGVDYLHEPYIGYFYYAAPILLICTFIYILLQRIATKAICMEIVGCTYQGVPLRIKINVIYIVIALCLFLFVKFTFIATPQPFYHAPHVEILYDSLNKIKLKDERIVLTFSDPYSPFSEFVGVAAYAKRKKNPLFCLTQQSWLVGYTDALKCTKEEEKNKLKYMLQSSPPMSQFSKPLKMDRFYLLPDSENYLTHNNMTKPTGHLVSRDNEEYWLSDEDREGWVWHGPYITLRKGEYDVYFNVTVKPLAGNKIDRPVKLDVCKGGRNASPKVLTERLIQPADYNKNQFVLSFSLKDNTPDLEFRIYKFNNTVVEAKNIVIHRR